MKNSQHEDVHQLSGSIKSELFHFDLIDRYFRMKNNSGAFHILSEKTCNDLDFKELFKYLDRTTSRVGQQYLFDKIRAVHHDPVAIETDEVVIDTLMNNPAILSEIQKPLNKLCDTEAYYINSLFQEAYLKPPGWLIFARILSFVSVVSILSLFFFPKAIFVLLMVVVINLVIHYRNKNNLFYYTDSMPQLIKLKAVASALLGQELLKSVAGNLAESIRMIDKLKKHMILIRLEANMQGDLTSVFWGMMELVKIVFLIEPIMLFDVLRRLENKKHDIENIYRFVGHVDALVSIALLRKCLWRYCMPAIMNNSQELMAKEVYHPLIPGCIDNTLSVRSKSVLLTGSNMSGKTTFIRTIGINVLSGLALNTCFAKEFRMPKCRVFSAIRITDDLLNNKSYYFEEVLTIKEMITESRSIYPCLFLLDEIFKGTNTIERISAGKAVLSYLSGEGNLVFVSTHDIELAELLKSQFDLYHFSEMVDKQTVAFDYKLKNGKLKNRNAIKILEINGYPPEIINEAISLARLFDNSAALSLK